MATKSGKRFQQARRAEIEAAKRAEIEKAQEKARAEQTALANEAERKARLAKIQAGWFALTG
jgi:hypothetical protein